MTTLTTTVCWNPFILNGRQVTNIIFYNDEGIMFETHRGWFGNGNNVFRTLNVGDVKTRRVTALEKMDKKENFCVTTKIPYSNDKGYALYLYVDGEGIQLIKEEEKEEIFSPTQIRKYVERTIRLYGIMIDLEETLKFIDNEFGKKVKEFQEELESFGIKLNCWDVENILKHYEFVRRS